MKSILFLCLLWGMNVNAQQKSNRFTKAAQDARDSTNAGLVIDPRMEALLRYEWRVLDRPEYDTAQWFPKIGLDTSDAIIMFSDTTWITDYKRNYKGEVIKENGKPVEIRYQDFPKEVKTFKGRVVRRFRDYGYSERLGKNNIVYDEPQAYLDGTLDISALEVIVWDYKILPKESKDTKRFDVGPDFSYIDSLAYDENGDVVNWAVPDRGQGVRITFAPEIFTFPKRRTKIIQKEEQ